MKIELVLDSRATIGESLTWVPEEQALYWADIKAPALYKTDVGTWTTRSWNLPSDVGAFALDGAGHALVALRTGLYWLTLATGALTLQTAAPFDPSLLRFNEGACDSAGRFWIGVMCDPLGNTKASVAGSLYSFTKRDGLRAHHDRCTLFNGMGWNSDESQFYLSHSYENIIFRFAYDRQTGHLGSKTEFVHLDEPGGIPDGAAIDREGGYWCAVHGAGLLHRYTSDGKLDSVIPMPVSQPTMCCFAGDDLKDLYITSAREKLSQEQLRKEPNAGGMFRLRPSVGGQAKHWRVT